jgi:catechol 2,3-dioxygenase-like lactoylglutathione lyase family enzyme
MRQLAEIARFAADVDRTVLFYERLLGVKPETRKVGETATFMLGGVKLFLHKRTGGTPDGPRDEDHIPFIVHNVDEACAALRAQGTEVEFPPRDFYWGRSAYLRDPDGRLVEL